MQRSSKQLLLDLSFLWILGGSGILETPVNRHPNRLCSVPPELTCKGALRATTSQSPCCYRPDETKDSKPVARCVLCWPLHFVALRCTHRIDVFTFGKSKLVQSMWAMQFIAGLQQMPQTKRLATIYHKHNKFSVDGSSKGVFLCFPCVSFVDHVFFCCTFKAFSLLSLGDWVNA